MREVFAKYQITEKDTLIVGCSGGPDSMYLVEKILLTPHHPKLIIAHVHHVGFREGSAHDRDFVQRYCLDHGLTYETMTIEVSETKNALKTSAENASRIERRSFFEELKEKYNARYIITAHHLDDQIETLMYRIIRGTKLTGLTGISEQEGDYLRPLLKIKKEDILSWLDTNNITYCHDTSNDDSTYLRNHIRHHIVPEFGKINPSYHSSFEKMVSYFTQMKGWIDSQFEEVLERKKFSVTYYLSLPIFLRGELVRSVYESTNSGTIGLSEANITEVMRYVEGEHGNKKKSIADMHLYKKGGEVSW